MMGASGLETEDVVDEQSPLDKARSKAAEYLNIDLREPKQERRIQALRDLYDKYSSQISICGYIYKEIIDVCNELSGIYDEKQKQLDESKVLDNSVIRVRLENINYTFNSKVQDLEKKLNFNKQLLVAYEGRYIEGKDVHVEYKQHLKKLEDICWENWLKALDVNKELRNTIIGFENRKALLKISKAYLDYYLLVDFEVDKCFKELKQLKKDGILEYYEQLRKYQLPLDKKIDFKIFLQKKIESKLSDAVEIKSLFGGFADSQRAQLQDSVDQIRAQYSRDQKDIISLINHYKNFLLQKQVLFTNEAERLVFYFKKRYVEKIDLLCSRFQMYNSEVIATNKKIPEDDLNLLKKLIDEEFQFRLNSLKIDFSKKLIPFLDNFWHLEQAIEKRYALDEEALINKFIELKNLKNLNLKHIIKQFDENKSKIKGFFDKKLDLVSDVSKMGVNEFDQLLQELKNDCDVVCCEVVNLNARFWTKANAEFNCVARRILTKLRHQYSPYIVSWRPGSSSWMLDYLTVNLNQELLKAAGEALGGFSPESDLYMRVSKALLYFNEFTRKILKERDDMEAENLMALNNLPKYDIDNLRQESELKLELLQKSCDSYWKNYNSFYSSLENNGIQN